MNKNNEASNKSDKPLTDAQKNEVNRAFDKDIGKALKSASGTTARLLRGTEADDEKMKTAFKDTEFAKKQAGKPIIDVTGEKATEELVLAAAQEAKAVAKSLIEQNPELKKKHEAQINKQMAETRNKFLYTSEYNVGADKPTKMRVMPGAKDMPPLSQLFDEDIIRINNQYAERANDGKYYVYGTKNEAALKPGDALEIPVNVNAQDIFRMDAENIAQLHEEAKNEKKLLTKNTSELTPADINKMTKEQRRSKFLETKDDETFHVNFKNKIAEQKIGLEDLLDEDTSIVMVTFGEKHGKEFDKSVYAVKGLDNKYLNPATGKNIPIFTGDYIYAPKSETDKARLASAAQELDREQSVRQEMLAKREKAKKREEQSPGGAGDVYVAKK